MNKNIINKNFYKEIWFFKAVMEQMHESVIVTNLDQSIVYINKASENLYGFDRKELLGEHPGILNAEVNKDEIQHGISRVINNGGTWKGLLKNKRKNGDIFLMDLTVSPLKNDKDETIGFVGFQQDATERIRDGRTLEETADALRQSNQELEEFAYVASHDLQEPLRVVSSYCQLLTEKRKKGESLYDEDQDAEKYFLYIIDATIRMKTLIEELLDFSRVGRRDKPFETINLNDLLEETMMDFEVKIRESSAKIIVEGDLPHILGIRFRIKQLLHNLISNALKFRSKESPFIRIGCCDEDSCWLFYVKDNGLGIDSKYMDRVFGIFKRLYSREEYPGTGIGLALCKRIVEAHGGKIWIDSEKDKGSYVYFTISKSIDFQEE